MERYPGVQGSLRFRRLWHQAGLHVGVEAFLCVLIGRNRVIVGYWVMREMSVVEESVWGWMIFGHVIWIVPLKWVWMGGRRVYENVNLGEREQYNCVDYDENRRQIVERKRQNSTQT